MSNPVLTEQIVRTPGVVGGKPRIAGRRIAVQHVAIWSERLGMTPDEIASEYDLTLAEIDAALTYYFDHRSEIDQTIAEDEAFIADMRLRNPSLLPPFPPKP